jgi:tetratricopeptide (TPR) repeat protein
MFNSKSRITNRDVAQELLKRGVYEFQTGNYSNALKIINQAIEIKPNYYEALVIRASLIYPLLNNYQGIIEDWTKVITINPTNSEAYNNRGFAFSRIGGHFEAVKDYTRALMIDIDSDNPDFYNNRAWLFIKLDDYYGALEDFKKAAQLYLENGNSQGYQKMLKQIKLISQ